MLWMMLALVGGLMLLVVGGEAVVRGAVATARRMGVSELFIGLVLVGFGTSTPELVTSLSAALSGTPGVALGNVVGSNIANILLILGTVALIRPIPADPAALTRDGAIMIAVTAMLVAVGVLAGAFPRWAGGLFVLMLAGYILLAWRMEQAGHPAGEIHREEVKLHEPGLLPLWQALGLAAAGLLGLILGARLFVDGAVSVARVIGISETVIGLTVVAVGTSLPELVATLMAALRGRSDVALGNVVGSNIYNVLGILGITALVSPLPVPPDLVARDWIAVMGAAVLMVVHAATGAKITRAEGGVLLGCYVLYLYLLF